MFYGWTIYFHPFDICSSQTAYSDSTLFKQISDFKPSSTLNTKFNTRSLVLYYACKVKFCKSCNFKEIERASNISKISE